MTVPRRIEPDDLTVGCSKPDFRGRYPVMDMGWVIHFITDNHGRIPDTEVIVSKNDRRVRA